MRLRSPPRLDAATLAAVSRARLALLRRDSSCSPRQPLHASQTASSAAASASHGSNGRACANTRALDDPLVSLMSLSPVPCQRTPVWPKPPAPRALSL